MNPIINPITALFVAGAFVVLGALGLWASKRPYWQYRLFRERVRIEDALKHFHHCEYLALAATLDSLSGALKISPSEAADLVARLETLGLLRSTANGCELTAEGRRCALRVIRVHRLWERYLAERTGVAETDWHEKADRWEHRLSEDQANALAAELGDPRYDPHGAPIPTASGDVAPAQGEPLTSLSVGQLATIVHVGDKPAAVYAQLVAQGLSVGTRVRVLEVSPERVRFEADGEEQVLAPVVAANVSVIKLAMSEQAPAQRLSRLKLGERSKVLGILPACRGLQRRRLLDLGLVPGTVVEAKLQSPSGDPTAYHVRGALIALRKQQADLIRIEQSQNGAG